MFLRLIFNYVGTVQKIQPFQFGARDHIKNRLQLKTQLRHYYAAGRVTTTTESSTNGAATLSRMIFLSGYVYDMCLYLVE